MLIPLARLGAIEDLGLDLRWDAEALRREVERRAAVLRRMLTTRGSVVAVAHGGSAYFFADLLAVWRIGATAACLDPALTQFERATLLEFLQPAVILVDAPLAATAAPQVALRESVSNAVEQPPAANPDDPALILFTSGTTGSPKGVVLSFAALAARLALNRAAIGESKLARTLVTLPTHFGHGLIGNGLTALLNGGAIVLPPRGLPLAQNLSEVIDDHAITFLSSVPALWRIALKLARQPSRATLARVHVGSAPLSAALWSDIRTWSDAEVANCYGMTEAANWIAGASSRHGIGEGLVGVMWGGQAAVIAEDGQRHASGEGEISVYSPSLMSGYLRRPDLTDAVMHDGWLRTGDRGSIDKDGRIHLTGRIKDEINRAGRKVQPAEIDLLVEQHPAVAQACTFSLPDPVSGEAVAIAVQLAPGAPPDIEVLRAWCRERLHREAVPERWFVLGEIPRSMRGKVDRNAVRRQVLGDRVRGDIAPG